MFTRRQLLAAGLSLCPLASLASPERVAAMERILATSLPGNEPGAAVLVLAQGQVQLRLALGLADLETRAPLRPEHLFRIGSITKPFTALAILLLMDRGQLTLDDPIGRHLPAYPEPGRRITLRQLLTHQAGLPDYTRLPAFRTLREAVPDAAALLAYFQHEPLDFVPGERHVYSNSGYAVLGAVIEAISGQPYGRFMAQHVFQPLGMADTGLEDRAVHAVVKGYGHRQGKRQQAPVPPSANTYASGGLVSTVDDLARFALAVDAGRLLKPATWALAFGPVPTRDGQPTRYGLGWQVHDFLGQPRVQHGGSLAGFSSHLLRLPQQRTWVMVLMNDSAGRQPGPGFIAEQLAAAALGQTLEAPQAVPLDAAQLAAVAGVYGADPTQALDFRVVDAALVLHRGATRMLLQASAPLEFWAQHRTLVRFQFEADAQGQVGAVRVLRPGIAEERLERAAPARSSP